MVEFRYGKHAGQPVGAVGVQDFSYLGAFLEETGLSIVGSKKRKPSELKLDAIDISSKLGEFQPREDLRCSYPGCGAQPFYSVPTLQFQERNGVLVLGSIDFSGHVHVCDKDDHRAYFGAYKKHLPADNCLEPQGVDIPAHDVYARIPAALLMSFRITSEMFRKENPACSAFAATQVRDHLLDVAGFSGTQTPERLDIFAKSLRTRPTRNLRLIVG